MFSRFWNSKGTHQTQAINETIYALRPQRVWPIRLIPSVKRLLPLNHSPLISSGPEASALLVGVAGFRILALPVSVTVSVDCSEPLRAGAGIALNPCGIDRNGLCVAVSTRLCTARKICRRVPITPICRWLMESSARYTVRL